MFKFKRRYFFSYMYQGGNGETTLGWGSGTWPGKIRTMADLSEMSRTLEASIGDGATNLTIINWRRWR